MTSPPIADLGIADSPAASVRPRRQPIERSDAHATGGVPTPVRAGAAPRRRKIAPPPADNVIELDTPRPRRSALRGPASAPPTPRIDPRAVALAVRVADELVAATAGIIAYRLQPGLGWPVDPTAAFAGIAVMAMLARLPDSDPPLLHEALRRPLSRRLGHAVLRRLLPFVVSILVVVALVPTAHVLRAPLVHWLTLWAMGAVAGSCCVRLCLVGCTGLWRRQGRLRQAVAIFGTGDLAERLLARLQASSRDSIELVGVFDDRARQRITSPGLRSLAAGTSDDLIALSHYRDIDRVLVALPHAAEQRVVEVLKKLRLMPVEISLAPDFVGFNVPSRDPDELGGLPLLAVYDRPLTFGQVLLKGAVDKLFAAASLILGAPLFLALAIAIKLDSKGPVLFRQNRHGFGDRVIGVYKFRTMADDAADYNGVRQAGRNDPRITQIGHFLRRWSLDELPQLINVLRGEMSLVGPRPHAISMQVEKRPNRDIVPDYALRHHMKPGLTGWAQVNGCHGPVETEEALRARVRYDLDYINNWSLWFDFLILLRTLRIVLGRRHAY